jgi:hypothetical protein
MRCVLKSSTRVLDRERDHTERICQLGIASTAGVDTKFTVDRKRRLSQDLWAVNRQAGATRTATTVTGLQHGLQRHHWCTWHSEVRFISIFNFFQRFTAASTVLCIHSPQQPKARISLPYQPDWKRASLPGALSPRLVKGPAHSREFIFPSTRPVSALFFPWAHLLPAEWSHCLFLC